MRSFYLTIIIFTIHFISFSQSNIDYLNMTNEAEYLYHEKQFKKAYLIINKAKKQFKYNNSRDFWISMEILKQEQKFNKAYRTLKKYKKKEIGKYYNLTAYLKNKGYDFTDKQFRKLSEILPDSLDINYTRSCKVNLEIKKMISVDQNVRKLFRLENDLVVYNNDTINYFLALKIVDDLNAEKLKDMIFNSDFIHLKYIEPADFRLLLLHMSYENFIKIERSLLDMIELGNLDPYHFASAKDRAYISENSCIIYFAYTISANKYDCINFNQVIENRKKIGLTTFYSRSSVRRIIPVGKQMKWPLYNYIKLKLD